MLTASEIANKNFRRSLLGYEMEQVDAFLDEVILEMERLYAERNEMLTRMDALQDVIYYGYNSPIQIDDYYGDRFR